MTLELGLFLLLVALVVILPPLWVFERIINSDGELTVRWKAQGRQHGKARTRP